VRFGAFGHAHGNRKAMAAYGAQHEIVSVLFELDESWNRFAWKGALELARFED
jgi:hypothetical protein